MTDQEWQAIEARHFPTPSGRVCDYDPAPGPCDVRVVLAEVERLRGGLRAILDQPREISEGSRRAHCEVCYPQDGVYPCVTVLEARAALEGRE